MTKIIHAPIGIFDSGLGGLTVFKEIARLMPEESLIYFGDTAHVPYGSKSPEAITRFSTTIARFLVSKGIKLLVVACNTSSAWALSAIRQSVSIPVIGVIEPGARAALAASKGKSIGIIGTEATIKSQAYSKAIRSISPQTKTVSQACPLFVPLVEEGLWKGPIATSVAEKYASPLKLAHIDTLILGCTHYPFLKSVLSKVMGPKVILIDSAKEVALETRRVLIEKGLRQKERAVGKRQFYASDAAGRFAQLGRRLLGQTLSKVKLHSFDL